MKVIALIKPLLGLTTEFEQRASKAFGSNRLTFYAPGVAAVESDSYFDLCVAISQLHNRHITFKYGLGSDYKAADRDLQRVKYREY